MPGKTDLSSKAWIAAYSPPGTNRWVYGKGNTMEEALAALEEASERQPVEHVEIWLQHGLFGGLDTVTIL